jgi:hypothetical protein
MRIAIPTWLTAAADVGAVDERTLWVEQPQSFAAVIQHTCVNLVRGHVGDGRVVGALEQEIAASINQPFQVDFDIAAVGVDGREGG